MTTQKTSCGCASRDVLETGGEALNPIPTQSEGQHTALPPQGSCCGSSQANPPESESNCCGSE
jgi:hypothetical protein